MSLLWDGTASVLYIAGSPSGGYLFHHGSCAWHRVQVQASVVRVRARIKEWPRWFSHRGHRHRSHSGLGLSTWCPDWRWSFAGSGLQPCPQKGAALGFGIMIRVWLAA